MVFRMAGKQFAGATQLLSAGACSASEVGDAAESMAAALQGQLPESGTAMVPLPNGCFKWREFRTPTKQLLTGLANCLQQALPPGFTLLSAKPTNPLRPSGPSGQRHRLTAEEMKVQALSIEDGSRFFNFEPESDESLSGEPAFLRDENFFRLVLSADEGTEAL